MRAPFEMWASPEPTVARIAGHRYRDQLAETGHADREGDLDLLASLGVTATRYPVLWERTAGDDAEPELGWARRRLERLRELGIEPIVTLLHHGSGPPSTDLLDATFAQRFATYADAVARAFPWVRRWTPINEPLTTARFATLYGYWYPNLESDVAFGRAIVNEAVAMLLGMKAIRRHIPDAQFVLTEDLQGFVALDARSEAYVAHKRDRSFLSIELVMGRVVPGHPLYAYLRERCALSAAALEGVARLACVPDAIGWNYYPNSERAVGTDAEGRLTNVCAFTEGSSPRALLRAAHARLGLPFGLSEVHVSGPATARVAWLHARYADLVALHAEDLPVAMFGAWAAFGLCDWDSLLVRDAGSREDGIFTFAGRTGVPQETAVAAALRRLTDAKPVAARSWSSSTRR